MPTILFKDTFYKSSNIYEGVIKMPPKPTHTCKNWLVINIETAQSIEKLTNESTS